MLTSTIETIELDKRFLEAGLVRAANWHENQSAKNGEWNCYEILTPEMLATAYYLRATGDPDMVHLDMLVRSEPGLVEALIATTITEDGITYFPMGVTRTFNPENNLPDDSDPYNLFARRWSSQEYQHGAAEVRVMEILGLDIVELENLRKQYVDGGEVPVVTSSFDGVAYTAPQESLTSAPYQNMIRIFKSFYDKGIDPKSEVGKILGAVIEVYREISQEERLHRTFIANTAYDGLHSDDPQLSGAMMVAIANRFEPKIFPMPGSSMPGFRDRALKIARAKIFTPKDVARAKLDLLRGWKLEQVNKITAIGYEAQKRLIGKFALSNNDIKSE